MEEHSYSLDDNLYDIDMKDKLAIIQLIYQLIISSDRQIVGSRDDRAIDLVLIALKCSNEEWNFAIENTNPYESFTRVSELPTNLKSQFLSLLEIVTFAGGNQREREDIARQIQQRIQ